MIDKNHNYRKALKEKKNMNDQHLVIISKRYPYLQLVNLFALLSKYQRKKKVK